MLEAIEKIQWEENLIQNDILGQKFQIRLQNQEQLLGIGFWSQCVPQLISDFNYKLDSSKFITQQQFLVVATNQFIELLASVEFNDTLGLVQHIITLTQINEGQQQLFFKYQPSEYEGKWIFNIMIFDQTRNQINIQLTEQNSQQFYFNSKFLDINLTLGGIYTQQNYILDYFKGRYSQLIVQQNLIMSHNLFQEFSLNNSLKLDNITQQFYLNPNLIIRNDMPYRMPIQFVDQRGDWFAISGWVKHELKRQIQQSYVEAIKLSLSKYDRGGNKNTVFSLSYCIDKMNQSQSSIVTSAHLHSFPLVTDDSRFLKKFIKIFQEQNQNIYIAIQSWHFFQYSYFKDEGGMLQINFQNDLGLYQTYLGDKVFNKSFINSQFQIEFGENLQTKNYFYGSLYQIQFFHKDGLSNFRNLNFGCDPLCDNCDGPFKTNCLSCKNFTNRILIEEIKECSCQLGYQEFNNYECKLYLEIYPIEIEEEKLQQDHLCELGYFRSPFINNTTEQTCIQCPINNKGEIYCLECILNPNTWYQEPNCETFMQSRQQNFDDAYLINKESRIHKFVIDSQNYLFSLSVLLSFCKQTSDCKHYQNLKITDETQFAVEYFSRVWLLQQPYCFNVSIQNSNCIQCLPGYYENDGCAQCFPFILNWLKFDQCRIHLTKDQLQTYDRYCGSYCSVCEGNRCYQCVDDSKYYVSLDGRTCRKNDIPHCLQAFQALNNNYKINTLFLYFEVSNQKDSVILCARCEDNYVFIFSLKQCVKLVNSNCLFAVAESFDQFQKNDQLEAYIDDAKVYLNQSLCLITNEYQENTTHFFQDCYKLIANCVSCLKRNEKDWMCLECQTEYQLNSNNQCELCFCQSTNQNKTKYLNKVSAFYQYINGDFNNYLSPPLGRNKNHNYTNCHQTCLECVNKYYAQICLRCKANKQGRLLSLSNSQSQCIECPENCLLCTERTLEQALQINPLFNNQNFSKFTRICLKNDQNENLFYDKELGQFINCFSQKMCKKKLKIMLNLFCSQDEFDQQLQLLGTSSKAKFLNENILYKDLVQNQFPQYNQEFYAKANNEGIRKISITIYSKVAQVCQSDSLQPIINKFSQNIFSTLEVNLQFSFSDEMIFALPDKLIFKDFINITLQGIKFQIKNPNIILSIIFESQFILQSIKLSNLSFSSQEIQCLQECFSFIQVENLHINNFTLRQINLQNGTLFDIKPIQKKQNLNFKALFFSSVQFKNFVVVNHYFYKTSVNFEKNFVIDCIFTDSFFVTQFNFQSLNASDTIVQLETDIKLSLEILTSKITFLQDFINDRIFFNFEKYNFVTLKIVNLIKSEIFNTKLMDLNENSSIDTFYMGECYLENSQILFTSLKRNGTDFNFFNLSFQSNIYDMASYFINIDSYYQSSNNKLQFTGLNMSNNQILESQRNLAQSSQYQSVIQISLNIVTLNQLFIQRGKGFSEFGLTKIVNLTISCIYIFQDQTQRKLTFHQNIDCLDLNLQEQNAVLNFYQINYLQIQDMNIKNIQSINSPIIYYRSKEIEKKEQFETIVLNRIQVHQNIIILEKKDAQGGIFKFLTFQNSKIIIQDCNFSRNIMQVYQGELESQASLISIEAELSSLTLQDSFFKNNIIINSFDSIINIKCHNIFIKNCTYLENNLLSYEILQPWILWDFSEHKTIFQEDIFDIFQIKSLSGNGVLQFNKMVMENITIKESRALKGAGFKFVPQNYSKIEISDIVLNSVETKFSNLFADCGVLIFDLSNSVNLVLQMSNIIASSIFLYNQCSLIKIFDCSLAVDIRINNVEVIDIFSQSASLISVTFNENILNQNFVKISNVKYKTTQNGWENFINKLLYNHLIQNEITQIESNYFQNRTAFFIDFGDNALFENIEINGLQQEQIFVLTNICKVILKNIIIQNLVINQKLILIKQLDNQKLLLNSNILIQNLKVTNIHQESFEMKCKYFNRAQIDMLCSRKQISAPLNLKKIQINFKDFCSTVIGNVTESESLIQLLQITNSTNIYINDLEISLIKCLACSNGIFFIGFINSDSQFRLRMTHIQIFQSQCGLLSCIYISNINSAQVEKISTKNQYWPQIFEENQIMVENFHCSHNLGMNGTCLNINNLKVIIKNSNFQSNTAGFAGGALYFSNNDNFVFIENSYIGENYAILGGGIFIQSQFSLEYSKLHSQIQNNQAFKFGQNIYSIPMKLSFQYGGFEKNCQINTINFTENYLLDQVIVQKNKKIFGIETDYLLFPNGQEIQKYQYFDWQHRRYQNLHLQFRIKALTNRDEKSIDSSNASCIIKSGAIKKNFDQQNIIYTNNYTSFKIVYFNSDTEDYNLDNLQIYFQNDEDLLSIEFKCDSIASPIFNEKYPFNLLENHKNYSLRLFVRPLPCQLGEIKNPLKGTCDVCNFEDGFFVLELNSNYCQVRDDVSTAKVSPAQLMLREGFWRPYFDTSIVSYCENLQSNCLGGWVEGDQSCFEGHIGALCEQCDLINLRGNGEYYQTNSYSCSLCNESAKNLYLLIFLSLYVLISILLSVSSNIESVELQLRIIKMKILGFRATFLYNEKTILLKILTNYFQIIGTIYYVQKNIQLVKDNSFFNFSISPIQSMRAYFDCLISNNFKISVHYVRIIFQLIQPFWFIIMVFLFFSLWTLCSQNKINNLLVSTTLIYIYIYFQPILVGKLVQLVSFKQISGFKWILANVAYRYDDQTHYLWMEFLLLPTLFIQAFLIPIFFFYGLYSNSKSLNNKIVRQKWGYLYCEYTNDAYLWEILRIVQKSVLLGFLNYYEDFPTIQAFIIIFILLIYLQFSNHFNPYISKQLNNIDQSITNICSITCCSILLFNKSLNYQYSEVTLQFFFLSLNVKILGKIVSKIIAEYFKQISTKFKVKFDLFRDFIRNNFLFLNKYSFISKMIQNQSMKEQRRKKLYKQLKQFLIEQGKLQSEKQKYSHQSKKTMSLLTIKSTIQNI